MRISDWSSDVCSSDLLAAGTGTAVAEPLRLVAMGDFPYEEPRDFPRFERLIAAINRQPPALVVHIGDIKHGSSPCSEATYRRIQIGRAACRERVGQYG